VTSRSGNPETNRGYCEDYSTTKQDKPMKWKNIDIGAAYYYITGTFTEWLPLLNRADVRQMVCDDISAAAGEVRD